MYWEEEHEVSILNCRFSLLHVLTAHLNDLLINYYRWFILFNLAWVTFFSEFVYVAITKM